MAQIFGAISVVLALFSRVLEIRCAASPCAVPGVGFAGSTPLYLRFLGRSFFTYSWSFFFRTGKTDPVLFKGFLNRALFAYKNGRFASSFLLLGIGLLHASKISKKLKL